MYQVYDIIVIGAGHSGCEAAMAAGNLGSKVLLITMDMTKIAQMSCNPAIGGIAKGQIVREIDALGGYTGLVTDKSMIQFRMLNRSKGPAMWSPRAQCDRVKFSIIWRSYIEANNNIDLLQDNVHSLIITNDKIEGVVTLTGIKINANAVILTSGTFGNGLIHIGRKQFKGGRIAEPGSYGVSEQLATLGFEVGRMKTGTPARIDGRSVDFNSLVSQPGDPEGGCFSFLTDRPLLSTHDCFITHTNERTHRIIEKGFRDSPLYNGTIQSIGPRYCPSIEDKVVTFSGKKAHQLFLEPEGVDTAEYYLNGFSSSLPWNIQLEALRTIEGFENVKFFRPGYAIEYDYYPPHQLFHWLETKQIKGLFFAGQINGTTGYEEAAAQGLIAGINAHLVIKGNSPFVLLRDEAYIGVLIDDLITKSIDEPYRMFTSRAEYRLLLRQDNADERLTTKSYTLGLASKERSDRLESKKMIKRIILQYLNQTSIAPELINSFLGDRGTSTIIQKVKLYDLALRPQVRLHELLSFLGINQIDGHQIAEWLLKEIEIDIKYSGYFVRERAIADKLRRLEHIEILPTMDVSTLFSLSTEARHKLARYKPKTIGQASRISGISPSDINILLTHIGR